MLAERGHTGLEAADIIEITDAGASDAPRAAFSPLSRQIPVLQTRNLEDKDFDVSGKDVWIIGDEDSRVEQLAIFLKSKKAKTSTFIFSEKSPGKEIDAFLKNKSCHVIVDLTHDAEHSLEISHLERQLQFSSEIRFQFYKKLLTADIHPKRILCLTSMDGQMGLGDSDDIDAAFGALTGFYKALRKELDGVTVKIIDIAPQELSRNWDNIEARLLEEIEHSGIGVEIAYNGDERKIVVIDDVDIPKDDLLEFDGNDVILVSGGAAGIAAEATYAFAQKHPVKFILLGRDELPENVEELAQLDEAGMEQVRNDIMAELKKSQDKVTPAIVNKEYERLTKGVTVYKNLQRLRELGHEVIYLCCDVRERSCLKTQLHDAKNKLGPITGLVHAAGIDKSRSLAQKTLQEFKQVFSVKAQGALNLFELTKDDPLKFVVAFSSIAGRFGNAAQLDYSAANSFLNPWVKMMRRQHPGINAVSLIYSGWRDVGIAWRNDFVRQRSEDMGLHLVSVAQGVEAFMQETEHRNGNVEVIRHSGLNGFLEPDLTAMDVSLPLIDRIVKNNGSAERAYKIFSVRRDAIVDQHRLGATPILPAVAYSELAAEYLALQTGYRGPVQLRNITFENPFKLFKEKARELYIDGSEEKSGAWNIKIESTFNPGKSNIVQTIKHSSSTILKDVGNYDDMDPSTWGHNQGTAASQSPEESLMLLKDSGPDQRIILVSCQVDKVG